MFHIISDFFLYIYKFYYKILNIKIKNKKYKTFYKNKKKKVNLRKSKKNRNLSKKMEK